MFLTTRPFSEVWRGVNGPLPWVVDVDDDGVDEIVVWGIADPEPPGRILIPSLYHAAPRALVLDHKASRKMRARVAQWYERQAREEGAKTKTWLRQAAGALRRCGD